MKSRANEFLFTSHEISFHVIKSICWNDQTKRTISKGNGFKLDTVSESYQAYQAILQNMGRFDRDQMKSVKAVVDHMVLCVNSVSRITLLVDVQLIGNQQ